MTEERLKELEELMEWATHGPWYAKPGCSCGHNHNPEVAMLETEAIHPQLHAPPPIVWHGVPFREGEVCCIHMESEDAQFCAAARNEMPELIAEIRRLREENEKLKSAIITAAARKAARDPEAWEDFLKRLEVRTDGTGG